VRAFKISVLDELDLGIGRPENVIVRTNAWSELSGSHAGVMSKMTATRARQSRRAV
jgi:hypothetical protein